MSLAPTTPDRKNTTAKQQPSTSTHSKSLDNTNDSKVENLEEGVAGDCQDIWTHSCFSQNKTWQNYFLRTGNAKNAKITEEVKILLEEIQAEETF